MSLILLVATTNAGKLREIQALLVGLPIDVRALDASLDVAAPEEMGATFAENARLKARYYARATGLLTVAEDSGLEVDALDGRPGVLSARYPGATYEERFRNLYAELAARETAGRETAVRDTAAHETARETATGAFAEEADASASEVVAARHAAPARAAGALGLNPRWTARFACTLALVRGDELLFDARGTVEGLIAPAPRGSHGFGYDPIFFYPPYGRTFGEATDEEKSRVSHRGAAFRRLRAFLVDHPELQAG